MCQFCMEIKLEKTDLKEVSIPVITVTMVT